MSEPSPSQARPSPAPEAPWSESAPPPRVSAVASIEPPSERPPRVTTPPGGVSSLPVAAIDLWRDRARTVLDRFIYFGALVAIVYLRRHDQLDVGTGGLILLVCGVRPHNVGDVLAARVGGATVPRASAVVGAVGAGALSWRSFFGTCLVMGLLAGGCLHRQPGLDPGRATAKVVLSTASEIRDGLCDRALLGPVPPLDIDNAPGDLGAAVGQVRAWLCADVFGGLLDTVRELLTPRPSPAAESDGGTRDPSTPSPEDSSVSATGDGGLPSTPDASPGAPDDTGPPTVTTSDVDAGEVRP